MKKRLRFLAVLAIMITLTGCMNSQFFRERRINSNQEVFNSFSPEIQAKVRAGQVDVGFSEQMVYLAWGKANRIYTRTTSQGTATIWAYTKVRTSAESHWASIPVYLTNRNGQSVIRYRTIWVVDRDNKEEYTIARIEFIDGFVNAVEQLKQR